MAWRQCPTPGRGPGEAPRPPVGRNDPDLRRPLPRARHRPRPRSRPAPARADNPGSDRRWPRHRPGVTPRRPVRETRSTPTSGRLVCHPPIGARASSRPEYSTIAISVLSQTISNGGVSVSPGDHGNVPGCGSVGAVVSAVGPGEGRPAVSTCDDCRPDDHDEPGHGRRHGQGRGSTTTAGCRRSGVGCKRRVTTSAASQRRSGLVEASGEGRQAVFDGTVRVVRHRHRPHRAGGVSAPDRGDFAVRTEQPSTPAASANG